MEKTVLPIHFEDRSGTEFERLCFAYVGRSKSWKTLDWLGQSGSEGGRDIWGEDKKGKTHCYQCANYRLLIFTKAQEDIDKLDKNKTIPSNFIFICGGRVSAALKKRIEKYAKSKGIKIVETWTGVEFEEKLRKDTPELVRRFVNGEEFPDSPADLIALSNRLEGMNDKEIIELISECFDRPAFTTPFHQEVSIPDFEKALSDTIEVLNTGIHRLRDGTLIKKIPSRHKILSKELKNELSIITYKVVVLRKTLKDLTHNGEIRPCGCGQLGCSVYTMSPIACRKMNKLREEIFSSFRKIKPDFHLRIWR